MIHLEDSQRKLLEVIKQKQKDGISQIIYDKDLEFYNSFNDYLQDVRILTKNNFVSIKKTHNSVDTYYFFINDATLKEYENYLNSMEHSLYRVLCYIDKLLKGSDQINSSNIKIENISDEKMACIINRIVEKGFVKASNPIKLTTNKYDSYIISDVTFEGKQVIQNEEMLFEPFSQDVYIEKNIINNNNIDYKGNNGNIMQSNDSLNEKINLEQFRELKKDNWIIKVIKWIKNFWLQLIVGVITGIISTLIVEWIIYLYH